MKEVWNGWEKLEHSNMFVRIFKERKKTDEKSNKKTKKNNEIKTKKNGIEFFFRKVQLKDEQIQLKE